MTVLNGKNILVVGASGGLGAPLARALAEAGATLTLAGRDEQRLAAVGLPDARLLRADLREPEAGRALVGQMLAAGTLDGIVYAAGVVAFGSAADLTDDVVEDLLRLNYTAPQRLITAALPHLPAGGFALAITGVIVETPPAGMAAYCASKSALSAFLTSTRIEARRRKVRIIDARPPHTETGLATRPIAGQAPKLSAGLAPEAVAVRIVRAILDDETVVPSTAFGG